MNLQEVLAIAATLLASLGGAGAIIIAVSSWLGKVWANRIMQADKQRHSKELEQLQSELRKQTDSELERLRHYHQSEIDIMIRRREVYQRIAMAMRVFLSGSARASEDEKREFLKGYDLCYLWATDEVLAALGEFLDLNVTNTANPSPENQPRLQSSYGRCMTEMRKDAGFPGTSVDRGAYRIVNF